MLQRYEWEDLLIVAQRDGHLSNGALMVGLKLAKAVNWAPRKGRTEPGLYWKNDDAFKDVGLGRSTFYRHRTELDDLGFFESVSGNLIPRLPSSLPETRRSTEETAESPTRTQQSVGGQPFTEDSFTEDVLSVDVLTEDVAAADASAHDLVGFEEHSLTPNSRPLLERGYEPSRDDALGEFRQSLPGTLPEDEYSAMMSDWYAKHPETEVLAGAFSEASEGPAKRVKADAPATFSDAQSGPSVPSQRRPSLTLEDAS